MNTQNFIVTPELFASREKRFGTYILDIIGYYILAVLIGVGIGLLASIGIEAPLNYLTDLDSLENLVLTLIIYFTYYILFETLLHRTLGKFITQTKVVMEDGSKPGVLDIILRTLCRLIPFEFFSFLGEKGRGWHDSMSNTYVVDIKKFEAKKRTQLDLDLIGVTSQTDSV